MFSIPCTEENKKKMIQFVDQAESFFCLLNANDYQEKYTSYRWKLSFGSKFFLKQEANNAFLDLRSFSKEATKPIYGLLSYDLKNDVERLSSKNKAFIEFPSAFFFEEEVTIEEQNHNLVSSSALDIDYIEPNSSEKESSQISIIQHVSKDEYVRNVKAIQQHILDGDVYEINYCIPFEVTGYNNKPINLYFKLNTLSPNPFSGILKINHLYILSASPERFLKREGHKIVSQPIKGTIKKTDNVEVDKSTLLNSEKERAENVMIVDLVRNDLTKTAVTGSIKVEELFGIYTFPQLHQMISTVSSELDLKYDSIDVLKNAFPMGSMTGAPKVKAMELIDQFECFKRGAYSGSLGYIKPNGDFDFNVLIRSIFIDTKSQKINFNVGSAITLDSNPEEEYEECLLKAKAIFRVMSNE